jgi:hypothetical protein
MPRTSAASAFLLDDRLNGLGERFFSEHSFLGWLLGVAAQRVRQD